MYILHLALKIIYTRISLPLFNIAIVQVQRMIGNAPQPTVRAGQPSRSQCVRGQTWPHATKRRTRGARISLFGIRILSVSAKNCGYPQISIRGYISAHLWYIPIGYLPNVYTFLLFTGNFGGIYRVFTFLGIYQVCGIYH